MRDLTAEQQLELDRLKEELHKTCLDALKNADARIQHGDEIAEWVRKSMWESLRRICDQHGLDCPPYVEKSEVKDETQS